MRKIYLIIMLVVFGMTVYRFRYRIINILFAVGILRKMAVSLAMRVPYLRHFCL